MSHYYAIPLFDETALASVMHAAGADFSRLVGYFGDDGARCIGQIEQAHDAADAAALVDPACRLEEQARQMGARRLSLIAGEIEQTARRCLEQQEPPGTIAHEISMLRVCFSQTLALLCEVAPGRAPPPAPRARLSAPSVRPRIFGRRPMA